MNGKGSKRRPHFIDSVTFDRNWEQAFQPEQPDGNINKTTTGTDVESPKSPAGRDTGSAKD